MKKHQSVIDLSHLGKEYENRWVALDPEDSHVLASADSLIETRKQLDSLPKETPLPIFHRVPPASAVLAP